MCLAVEPLSFNHKGVVLSDGVAKPCAMLVQHVVSLFAVILVFRENVFGLGDQPQRRQTVLRALVGLLFAGALVLAQEFARRLRRVLGVRRVGFAVRKQLTAVVDLVQDNGYARRPNGHGHTCSYPWVGGETVDGHLGWRVEQQGEEGEYTPGADF